MQVLGKDSKMPLHLKMMMILIFSKCCNVSFGQKFFSNLQSKRLTDDVTKNVCDVITLI